MEKKIIEEFLMLSLFGANYKTDKKELTAINRAYRDFCRTNRIDKEFNKKVVLKDDKTKVHLQPA